MKEEPRALLLDVKGNGHGGKQRGNSFKKKLHTELPSFAVILFWESNQKQLKARSQRHIC